MFFSAFDNELVSSKLGPFGEADGEFRPTRLPPSQCAFKSFQDNDIMRKMPVLCCLDKFWERCAFPLFCFTSGRWVGHSKLDFSEKKTAVTHLSRGAVTQSFKNWPDFQTLGTVHINLSIPPTYTYKPDDVNWRSWMLNTSFNMTCGTWVTPTQVRDLVRRCNFCWLELPRAPSQSITPGTFPLGSAIISLLYLGCYAADTATRIQFFSEGVKQFSRCTGDCVAATVWNLSGVYVSGWPMLSLTVLQHIHTAMMDPFKCSKWAQGLLAA